MSPKRVLQTCIAKGNGIELLQASCTAITRYLLALSCKCCSSRRFPFQLVQVTESGFSMSQRELHGVP